MDSNTPPPPTPPVPPTPPAPASPPATAAASVPPTPDPRVAHGADPYAAVRAQEHLKILSILQMVFAGLLGLGALATGFYVAIGLLMMIGARDAEARAVGIVFVVFGVLMAAFFGGLAFLFYRTGCNIRDRRKHRGCIIAAGVQCMFMPMGTALGIFTIITLSKPAVKPMFDDGPAG